MESESQETPSLMHDLRRMVPVWILVIGTALVIVLMVRVAGTWHLKRTAYGEENSCEFAELYVVRALQKLDDVRDLAAAARMETIQANPESLNRDTLGLLSDDPLFQGVKADLNRALEICPTRSQAHSTLALVDWYLGNATAAYTHLGNYHLLEDRRELALVAFRVATEESPSDLEALRGLALALLEMGRKQDALEVVEGHELTLSQSAQGKIALGRVYSATPQKSKAIEYLKGGLSELPADRQAILTLVNNYRQQGNIREGADFLMTLGKDKRTIAESYHNAAILYRQLEDYESQAQALKKALELAPRNADLHFQLAVALYRLGRYSEARDRVQVASEHNLESVLRGIDRSGIDPRQRPE